MNPIPPNLTKNKEELKKENKRNVIKNIIIFKL